jgi:hypothetical protein
MFISCHMSTAYLHIYILALDSALNMAVNNVGVVQPAVFPEEPSDLFAGVIPETGPPLWLLMMCVNKNWNRAMRTSSTYKAARTWFLEGRATSYSVLRKILFMRSIGKTCFVTSCMEGNLEEAQGHHATWAFTTQEARTPPECADQSLGNMAFRNTIVNGHLHVAQWLYRTFGASIGDVTNATIYANSKGPSCNRRQEDAALATWLVNTFMCGVDTHGVDI